MNKNTRVHILENGYHIDISIIVGQRLILDDDGLYYFELLHKDLKTVFRTESHKSYDYLLMNCINTSNDNWQSMTFLDAYPEVPKMELIPLIQNDYSSVLFKDIDYQFIAIFIFLAIIYLLWFFS